PALENNSDPLLCLCFPGLTPRPRSTPFPYTTLFRSTQGGKLTLQDTLEVQLPDLQLSGLTVSQSQTAQEVLPALLQLDRLQLQKDRKSTRLNSSHVKSSYAVFCLKKKHHQVAHATLA